MEAGGVLVIMEGTSGGPTPSWKGCRLLSDFSVNLQNTLDWYFIKKLWYLKQKRIPKAFTWLVSSHIFLSDRGPVRTLCSKEIPELSGQQPFPSEHVILPLGCWAMGIRKWWPCSASPSFPSPLLSGTSLHALALGRRQGTGSGLALNVTRENSECRDQAVPKHTPGIVEGRMGWGHFNYSWLKLTGPRNETNFENATQIRDILDTWEL